MLQTIETARLVLQTIETARLVLRPFTMDDVLGGYEKWGYGRFAVTHKADDCFIGFVLYGIHFAKSWDADLGPAVRRAFDRRFPEPWISCIPGPVPGR